MARDGDHGPHKPVLMGTPRCDGMVLGSRTAQLSVEPAAGCLLTEVCRVEESSKTAHTIQSHFNTQFRETPTRPQR